jgi:hypothetical protein
LTQEDAKQVLGMVEPPVEREIIWVACVDANNVRFRPKNSDFQVGQRKKQRTSRILRLRRLPVNLLTWHRSWLLGRICQGPSGLASWPAEVVLRLRGDRQSMADVLRV